MVGAIPRSVLFGNPERGAATLSPDGRWLSFAAPLGGVMNLHVCPVHDDIAQAKPVTTDAGRGVRSGFWAYDSRHLLYLQDEGGDENWRLHSVDIETGEDRDLTPYAGVQARPVALSHRRPHEALVALNNRDASWHDVYRIDLRDGHLTIVEKNLDRYAGYLADLDLEVRVASKARPDGGSQLLLKRESGWEVFAEADFGETLGAHSIVGDGSALLAISNVGVNASRLVRVDLSTGRQDVLLEDEAYDVGSVLVHPVTREPQAAVIVRERPSWHVIDPAVADSIETIASIGAGDATVVTRTQDDGHWLIAVTSDIASLTYHLYDRESGRTRRLYATQPALDEFELAPMEPFSFEASDGLVVHGYLTFPPNATRSNLPAVLEVHGGPWARDHWGLNPTAQWLANRGYLCVQVNFRGSTGYGKAFHNAGNKEWGGKMHQDLVDAVDHLVTKGWVDRSRVAIMGGSYGGYAALCGAAFTPEVFRCAVDLVGPSSIRTLIDSVPPYWVDVARMFRMRAADPDTEPDLVSARSPLYHAASIRIPLLIAQGANDPRVKRSESEQIVAVLQENEVPHTYLLFEDEGHGFVKPENQERYRAAVESFLAEHLDGTVQS